ncbi:CLUMA_CG017396, isoform A [Clunio marinus]|uniref:Odorant receptor n=1 Tax=Clunio marinus TaxID=568069 RepID=A0A1J1IX64_9DIPT|nr:CLUMA_CG017396, isoform A [Clunio marinus]
MEVLREDEIGSFQMEDFTEFGIKFYKLIGLNMIPQRRTTWKEKLFQIFKSFLFVTFFLNIFLIEASMMIFVFKNSNDLSLIARVLPHVINLPYVVIKILYQYINRDKVAEIQGSLNEIFPKTRKEQNIFGTKNYVDELRKFTKIYGTVLVVGFTAFIFKGIVILFISKTNELPTSLWTPFHYERGIAFIPFLLWIYYIVWTKIIGSFAAEITLYTMVTLFSMSFDILRYKCEHIEMGESKLEDDELKQIKDIIIEHNKILELSKEWENIFSTFFLINFLQSSFFLCFIVFLMLSNGGMMLNYVPYLFAALSQTILICFLGQKMIDSSSSVGIGILNTELFNSRNTKMKQAILLIVLKSQKPSVLTMKKFGAISIETFTKVIEKYF